MTAYDQLPRQPPPRPKAWLVSGVPSFVESQLHSCAFVAVIHKSTAALLHSWPAYNGNSETSRHFYYEANAL